MGLHQAQHLRGREFAAGAAVVEEFDHRHLGVSRTEGWIAGIGGEHGRNGRGALADRLCTGAVLLGLKGDADFLQYLGVLQQVGPDTAVEIAACRIRGDGQDEGDHGHGQGDQAGARSLEDAAKARRRGLRFRRIGHSISRSGASAGGDHAAAVTAAVAAVDLVDVFLGRTRGEDDVHRAGPLHSAGL